MENKFKIKLFVTPVDTIVVAGLGFLAAHIIGKRKYKEGFAAGKLCANIETFIKVMDHNKKHKSKKDSETEI